MSDTEKLEYSKDVSEHTAHDEETISKQGRANTTEPPKPGSKRSQLERDLLQKPQMVQRFLDVEGSSWYIDPVKDVNFTIKKGFLGILSQEAGSITPVMLLENNNKAMHYKPNWLAEAFDNVAKDRAYGHTFASCIMLKRLDESWAPSEGDLKFLREHNCQTLVDVKTTSKSTGDRQDGIYCVIGESLHRVFRLFPDEQGAFVCGIVHDKKDLTLHDVPDIRHGDVDWISKFPPGEKQFLKLDDSRIPVPYSHDPSPHQVHKKPPLNGVTIAVKDVFDIEGFPTTASCKAYASYQGDARSTASVVDALIAFGATIVGKTKTAQFASGENAADWVDFQCPFNPRGDGSFEPYCSSTGSAAAVAAYEWIDAAIGTDTLGSIIQPAAGHGVFGLRPSHSGESSGDFGSSGCLENSALLDTLGPLTRSLKTLRVLTECLYGSKEPSEGKSLSRLLYPPELFDAQPQAKRVLLDGFVDDILAKFDIQRQKEPFNIAEEWLKSGIDSTKTPIHDYLQATLAHIQLYGSYHNNLEFCRGYEAKNGHAPLVNPLVRYKWKLGSEITKQQYDEACKRQIDLRTFLRCCAFSEGTILAIPANLPELVYREDSVQIPFETRATKLQGFGFDLHQCSYLAGYPELVVPIGQVPVISKTTGKSTFEPVCMALIGCHGSEHQLIDLAEKIFMKRGYPDFSVQAGETAFKVDTVQK